MRLCHCCCYC